MAVDMNEVFAVVGSIGNVQSLKSIRTTINNRLRELGHPEELVGEMSKIQTMPIIQPRVQLVEIDAKEICDLAKEFGELNQNIEAITLDLPWREYLKALLSSIIQEMIRRAVSVPLSTDPAIPEPVLDRNPQLRGPILEMQTAGMTWMDIWDAVMTYGPAIVNLVQKIITDWKAKHPQAPAPI